MSVKYQFCVIQPSQRYIPILCSDIILFSVYGHGVCVNVNLCWCIYVLMYILESTCTHDVSFMRNESGRIEMANKDDKRFNTLFPSK